MPHYLIPCWAPILQSLCPICRSIGRPFIEPPAPARPRAATERKEGESGFGGRRPFGRRPFVHPASKASAHSTQLNACRNKAAAVLRALGRAQFLKTAASAAVLPAEIAASPSDDDYETGPILTCLSAPLLPSPLPDAAAPSCFAHRFSWNPAISKTRERTQRRRRRRTRTTGER